jgi:hypothetical protein
VARPVAAVAALGAEERFVSAFQLSGIRDRRQFSRRFIAALQRHCMRRVDPDYSKALPDELVQFDLGA